MNPKPILETTLDNLQIFVYDQPFNMRQVSTKALHTYLFDPSGSNSCCPEVKCYECPFKVKGQHCPSTIADFLRSNFNHSHPEAFI